MDAVKSTLTNEDNIKTEKSEPKALGKRQSIVKRLLARTLSVILVVLIAVQLIAVFTVKKYYYASVEQQMEASIISIRNKFWSGRDDKYNTKEEYAQNVRIEIEDFAYKEQMELMGVDINGKVLITSSGFPVANSDVSSEPDFVGAKNSIGGSLSEFYTGKMNDEEVMSASVVLPRYKGENQADGQVAVLRVVVSLEQVNRQVIYILALITLMSLLIILLITYSNSYFINSLVIPVGEVSQTAKKIAQGDFTARLEVKQNDEIGDLCRNINNMAAELSKAEQVKNEFISSVSHELRTPLTAIRGWAETLTLPGADEETQMRGMKVILSETERLGNMVEELLDFSKMQSGKFSLMMDKMDIIADLEETEMMFHQRAVREGVEIKTDMPEYISPIMGDENRLKQVFVNLIDNAFKYTESGGDITLGVRDDEETQSVIVKIGDSGCGINEEDLKKVKERFYKGKGARRGSGIGLSVVDEIITRHGGTFEMESEIGVGTTAVITLPTYDRWCVENNEESTEKEI